MKRRLDLLGPGLGLAQIQLQLSRLRRDTFRWAGSKESRANQEEDDRHTGLTHAATVTHPPTRREGWGTHLVATFASESALLGKIAAVDHQLFNPLVLVGEHDGVHVGLLPLESRLFFVRLSTCLLLKRCHGAVSR